MANQADPAKILQPNDFRGIPRDSRICFPSWTSGVRISSPAVSKSFPVSDFEGPLKIDVRFSNDSVLNKRLQPGKRMVPLTRDAIGSVLLFS